MYYYTRQPTTVTFDFLTCGQQSDVHVTGRYTKEQGFAFTFFTLSCPLIKLSEPADSKNVERRHPEKPHGQKTSAGFKTKTHLWHREASSDDKQNGNVSAGRLYMTDCRSDVTKRRPESTLLKQLHNYNYLVFVFSAQ